jgi:CheY-like chemotaxis protein/anti-sigma regulatory factor (Ser/Thr protein kinase)
LLGEALTYTRRLMSDLAPPAVLHYDELSPALEWLAENMRHHGLEVQVNDFSAQAPLDHDVLTVAFQSVRELLLNVLKHAGTRRAEISINRSRELLELAVTDEGKGFDMSVLSGPTREGGFGLFNIRERMHHLSGDFQIHSRPGEGTKAVLYVPLTDAVEPRSNRHVSRLSSPDTARIVSQKPGQAIRVLLVDDHVIVREGLRSILESQPDMIVIAEASTAETALELAFNLQPDIIVMDVSLPGMDGMEATRRLTAELPHIRVIGLSLHQEKEIEESMRLSGACAYLTKDEAFETLGATIRACMHVDRPAVEP